MLLDVRRTNCKLIGTFSGYVGNAKEDVDLKMNVYFYLEFCEWLDVINSPYGAASWPQHRIWERRWVPNGNVDNLPSRLLFSDHANFDDFKLLFCWGRLRNVHTLKTHEPSYCSAHYIFCFATSSLPSPSWFAKGPYSCNCTEPFILYELQSGKSYHPLDYELVTLAKPCSYIRLTCASCQPSTKRIGWIEVTHAR